MKSYGFAFAVVAFCTALSLPLFRYVAVTDLVMVYLLGTLVVATRGKRGPAAASAVLSVLAFNFFFVPPRFTLRVSEGEYLVTFIVMFATAMVISHLAIRLRAEADAARESEQRSVWLLEKAKRAEIETESERMRSSILSAVSHDLRTPLAAIIGSASALLGKELVTKNADIQEQLKNIQEEGERLSRLVQNLLQATRLEAGKVTIKKEAFVLEEVVGSAIERLSASLKNRPVHVKLPERLPLIPMDSALIEQVFINLLENAVRHTPIAKSIAISAKEGDRVVTITVADSGSGLNPDELQHAFDKFYHGTSSSGSGLGLAICRAIVDAHGGHIWAENRMSGGAAFHFTMPLKDSDGL